MRAIFYWLGTELDAIDDAVSRCFVLAGRHGLLPSDARAAPWLGHLAWRIACASATAGPSDAAPTRTLDPEPHASPAPSLPPAADALARFLAAHAEPTPRAAFVLAEFAGLGPAELATLLRCAPGPLHAELRRLRQRLADDPEVRALGGPRALLAASLAPFVADLEWTRRHAASLAARVAPPRPGLRDILTRPAGVLGLGLAAIALLLLLRPGPPAPPPTRPTVAIPRPSPPPPPAILPPPIPAPVDMSPEPASKPRLARVRPARKRAPDSAGDALARREQQARSHDPGAIILELEMIGAGRKALAASPAQALAYADQHARDYPDSQLVAQRAELRVRALCALGRRDEARAEAERRGPGKVRDALQQACGP